MDNSEFRQMLIKRSYKFSLEIISLIDSFSSRQLILEVIAHQLIRCSMSIGSNIVEAQACLTKKDFINFLTHSLKSANETKYWLALLRDAHKVEPIKISPLLEEVNELANMLGSSLLSLKRKNN